MVQKKRQPELPALSRRRRFQRLLLGWYRRHRRDLPWRHTRDPYRILVSEIMLQQTQVRQVLPKYEEFLRRYPTIRKLALAPVQQVRADWYPLGYNIRPLRLHSIARETVERYGGNLPDSREELLAMEGIGPYTAGAILSFAFGQAVPILDTNASRLLQRVFWGPVGRDEKGRVRKWLLELSQVILPADRAYDFNQALMDFGSLVCTAKKPACLLCPLRVICASYPWSRKGTAK